MKKLLLLISVLMLANLTFAQKSNSHNEDFLKEKLFIEITNENNKTFELTATLVNNSSTKELVLKLKNSSVTIDMHDFSNFEKVGYLPFLLPRNDTQFSTDAGDLILYLGKRFVIYYDKNNWNFTRLGFIDQIKDKTISKQELKNLLGKGNCKAVLKVK